ncbi:MAG: hypothetical protein D6790_17955, partial [Caldilineae bacterium]
MSLQRLTIKQFLANPEQLHLPAVVPVFHRWIQEKALEDLLIDVADYKHIVDGPGVVLVGHEGDYGVDLTGGRPGLLYRRKRELPETLTDALRLGFQRAEAAQRRLQQDLPLHFRANEAEVALVDRLRFPNTQAAFEAIRGEVEAVAQERFGPGATVERVENDPRAPLTLRLAA